MKPAGNRVGVALLVTVMVGALPPARSRAEGPPSGPPVAIILGPRHGHVTPHRAGFEHTGGGNIDVAQPTPDVVIITMTGVAVAGAHPCKDSVASMNFDLDQGFEVAVADPKITRLKVTLEGRVIGLLRSRSSCLCKKACGTADICEAHAVVLADQGQAVALDFTSHAVAGGDNLSINDHEGPIENPITPGKYTLKADFGVSAAHPQSVLPCKAASAEFAPDPALDPLWISAYEPFHGAIKKDFGFQITLRVAAAEGK